MLSHTEAETTRVAVSPGAAGPPVDAHLFGKFVEHLYSARNAKNALEAQLLHNPTFGAWKFQRHSPSVDGGRPAVHDGEEVAERIESYAERRDYPDHGRLREAYDAATALWWFPVGDADTSPDVGRAEDRAQRVECAAGAGLAQWCHLPLHRARGFEGDVAARAPDPVTLRVALSPVDADGALGDALDAATVEVDTEWTTREFDLTLPRDADDDPDALYALSVTAPEGGHAVLDHCRLYPDDHRAYADPAVVEVLRETALPLLRWPGGNFVSGYHWRDGVGPLAERPTRPNPAWDGLETNFFGTAEFLDFCEAVGCEPMICLNAGNGTAGEAAAWVEYCNGSTDTEMGALRAAHGHPEPWDVTLWEVGNEVYGEWQTTWTTAAGYADRYERFHDAMTGVDDAIEVLACGNRLTDWNDPLLASVPERVDYLTDHVLVGSSVDDADALPDLFGNYMALAASVREEYDEVLDAMESAGVPDPRVALTELQLFATPGDGEGAPDYSALPTSRSVTEALYDATFVHEGVRSGGGLAAITHSGVGNHGGGLRAEKERLVVDPCTHYFGLGAALAGGTPLGVELACPTYDTETDFATDTLPLFGDLPAVSDVPVVDPLAVLSADGETLSVDLVHRDPAGDEREVTVAVGEGFDAAGEATATTLAGESMAEGNSLDEPERVVPEESSVTVEDDEATVEVPPWAFVRVAFERA